MLNDFKKLVDSLVRDESERLAKSDKETAVGLAVARYGQDRPRCKVADVVAPGGDSLPLPAGWEAESELVSAEYPIGETPPAHLPCSIYTTPAGNQLRPGDTLGAGAEVRLTFTVAHVVSDTLDTVPPSHREAVACWAAAWLLEQLAAAAINDGESTLSADSTDRRTKAQEYASRARALKARYSDTLGVGNASPQAASGQTAAWPSRPRLTHMIRRNE